MMNDITPAPVSNELEAPPTQKPFWGPWATAGFGAVILVALLLVTSIVALITMIVIGLNDPVPTSIESLLDSVYAYAGLLYSVSGIISYAVGIGLIIAFIKVRGGIGIGEYLGLKRINWKVLAVALLVAAAFQAVAIISSHYSSFDEGDTNMLVNIYDTSVWPVLLWIAVVVFAPLGEEFLFRGFLFEGFRNSRLGIIGTVFLTSFIWTVLHAGYSIPSLGEIFVFGLILGAVRNKTGSVWSVILMHAVFNAVAMIQLALGMG